MDLQVIFDAIMPYNIKNLPLVKICSKIFIEHIERNSQVSINIRNLFDLENDSIIKIDGEDITQIIDSDAVKSSKDILRLGLFYTYINCIYSLIIKLERSGKIPKRFFNSEYLGGLREYQKNCGSKRAIHYMYAFAKYLETGTIVHDLELTEGSILNLRYDGSLNKDIFIDFNKPLAHPCGWLCEYERFEPYVPVPVPKDLNFLDAPLDDSIIDLIENYSVMDYYYYYKFDDFDTNIVRLYKYANGITDKCLHFPRIDWNVKIDNTEYPPIEYPTYPPFWKSYETNIDFSEDNIVVDDIGRIDVVGTNPFGEEKKLLGTVMEGSFNKAFYDKCCPFDNEINIENGALTKGCLYLYNTGNILTTHLETTFKILDENLDYWITSYNNKLYKRPVIIFGESNSYSLSVSLFAWNKKLFFSVDQSARVYILGDTKDFTDDFHTIKLSRYVEHKSPQDTYLFLDKQLITSTVNVEYEKVDNEEYDYEFTYTLIDGYPGYYNGDIKIGYSVWKSTRCNLLSTMSYYLDSYRNPIPIQEYYQSLDNKVALKTIKTYALVSPYETGVYVKFKNIRNSYVYNIQLLNCLDLKYNKKFSFNEYTMPSNETTILSKVGDYYVIPNSLISSDIFSSYCEFEVIFSDENYVSTEIMKIMLYPLRNCLIEVDIQNSTYEVIE